MRRIDALKPVPDPDHDVAAFCVAIAMGRSFDEDRDVAIQVGAGPNGHFAIGTTRPRTDGCGTYVHL